MDGEFSLVVRLGEVASCVARGDAEQVVESVARLEGRVWRVAAVREALVVARVGETGHGELHS